MKPAAFQATVHGFRTVPSRGVVSLTIEAPIEQHAEIARIAEHGAWVAVARIQEPRKEAMPDNNKTPIESRPAQDEQTPERAKREWRELQPSAQAAIRCGEPAFRAFLTEKHECDLAAFGSVAQAVRDLCCVESRKDLNTNHQARVLWHQLDNQFQAWKMADA